MIALDQDGTILNFLRDTMETSVNWPLLQTLRRQGAKQVGIYTNQGGLPWFVAGVLRKDGREYPSPYEFVKRLQISVSALNSYGIAVPDIRISCFHPRAERKHIEAAAVDVRKCLHAAGMSDYWTVYTTARSRKPEAHVLVSLKRLWGEIEYWGDSPEDGEAALAAGVPFVPVERFFG